MFIHFKYQIINLSPPPLAKTESHIQTFRLFLLVVIFLIAICFSACKDAHREDVAKIVSEWTGKEIKFPEGLSCTSMGTDTIYVDLYSDRYKILLYVDSLGCSSCRLKLSEWKRIMAEADSLFGREVDFLFYFQPKKQNERDLQFLFRSNGFNHPVLIDLKNEIDKLNKFPSHTDYQCFLLDRDNKVVMIGNPSVNTGIWQLFKGYISERNNINQGKKEESLMVSKLSTLPPDFPSY